MGVLHKSSKKRFKNTRPLKLNSIKELDYSKFSIVEDFEIVLH